MMSTDSLVTAGIQADSASLIYLGNAARQLSLDLSAGARSILAGAHLSRFRGRGMDFAESREYEVGDDVRHIDWRVTARTGKPHTKLYVEERERPVFMVMDFSASMFFGTRGSFKSVTAARAAALAGWATVAAGDRIGGVIASQQGVRSVKPGSGRRGVLRLIRELSAATRNHDTADKPHLLNTALGRAMSVVHPGSLILLFSDFYSHDAETARLVTSLRSHNDLVACQILDPLEVAFPASGQYLVSDGVKKTSLSLFVRKQQNQYAQLLIDRRTRLHGLLDGLGVPLVELKNGDAVTDAMLAAFGSNKVRQGANSASANIRK